MDEPPEEVVYSLQVEHVTFSIAQSSELEEWFTLYSESKKQGKQKLGESYSYEYALSRLEEEKSTLLAILKRKQNKSPTPSQLMFLFRQKIPIPADLTWGEASDLISERLVQIEMKKQGVVEVPAERGQFQSGDHVRHARFGEGIVLKSEVLRDEEFVEVQFADGKKRLAIAFAKLEKLAYPADDEPFPPFEDIPF
jgi:hypothetical protein